jgi:hypothetical protein
MLALDDPYWAEITHAYGSASDIPGKLRQLAKSTAQSKDHKSEPLQSLWSSLCHQGDAYEASYAAVPHIVQIALLEHNPIDWGFFMLPSAIEIARVAGRAPKVPSKLCVAYELAIVRLVDCVAVHRNEKWDKEMIRSVTAALAVAKGHHRIAEAIMDLDDDWVDRIVDRSR